MKNEFTKHDDQAKTVIVIADTHANCMSELPVRLLTEIKAADYLIHLGDFTSLNLMNELKQINKFYGILGNHDHPDLQDKLNKTEEIEIGGKRLGLIHALINPIAGRRRMKRSFQNRDRLHAILYGHSHLPTAKFENGVFFFNPGSVAGKFPASIKTYGKLTIDGTISGEIIVLDTRGTLGPIMNIPCAISRKVVRIAESML